MKLLLVGHFSVGYLEHSYLNAFKELGFETVQFDYLDEYKAINPFAKNCYANRIMERYFYLSLNRKLIHKKRPIDLLRAFEIVSKEIDAALVYIGDGELRNEMEHYIKEQNVKNVYLMGFRNQTELPEFFYAIADIFVLPSSIEPWGLVVNEAMCFGLPVIVTDQVGSDGDLVKDGENGYVFKAGNVNELVSALKKLLQDETKRLKFGQYYYEKIKLTYG